MNRLRGQHFTGKCPERNGYGSCWGYIVVCVSIYSNIWRRNKTDGYPDKATVEWWDYRGCGEKIEMRIQRIEHKDFV